MLRQSYEIEAFLGIEINEENCLVILEYCSFRWMKENATKSVPFAGAAWDGGAKVFIKRGVNGGWFDT